MFPREAEVEERDCVFLKVARSWRMEARSGDSFPGQQEGSGATGGFPYVGKVIIIQTPLVVRLMIVDARYGIVA
jgi:hypothetical protein